jgi:DNA-directed RNA polymerase specialized sigma24 family protein
LAYQDSGVKIAMSVAQRVARRCGVTKDWRELVGDAWINVRASADRHDPERSSPHTHAYSNAMMSVRRNERTDAMIAHRMTAPQVNPARKPPPGADTLDLERLQAIGSYEMKECVSLALDGHSAEAIADKLDLKPERVKELLMNALRLGQN